MWFLWIYIHNFYETIFLSSVEILLFCYFLALIKVFDISIELFAADFGQEYLIYLEAFHLGDADVRVVDMHLNSSVFDKTISFFLGSLLLPLYFDCFFSLSLNFHLLLHLEFLIVHRLIFLTRQHHQSRFFQLLNGFDVPILFVFLLRRLPTSGRGYFVFIALIFINSCVLRRLISSLILILPLFLFWSWMLYVRLLAVYISFNALRLSALVISVWVAPLFRFI